MEFNIPQLEEDVHIALHKEVPIVPVPSFWMGEYVLRLYRPVRGDYLASIEDLMFCFEAAAESPRAAGLDEDVARLIVNSLEMQRPFIQEGLCG